MVCFGNLTPISVIKGQCINEASATKKKSNARKHLRDLQDSKLTQHLY